VVSGVGAGGAAVGGRVARAASRAGCVVLRHRCVGAAAAVASCSPGGLRARAHRTAGRGAAAGGGAGMRGRRGAVPSHRGGTLGPAAHRPDTHRRHRPPRPPRRPGDPPAPFSFRRCPGHHQPRRHPDHNGQPHAAGPGSDHAPQRARAVARAGRAPAALRPPRDHRRHREIQRPPGDEAPRQSHDACAQVDAQRLGSGLPGPAPQGPASRSPSPTTLSTLRTTANASPTTTGPPTR
jgi:hypothetical protein